MKMRRVILTNFLSLIGGVVLASLPYEGVNASPVDALVDRSETQDRTFILSGTQESILAVHNEVNGCGGGNTEWIPEGVNANFEPACNEHDRCYGDLRYTKSQCDGWFLDDMNDRCESTYSDWWEYPSLELCYGFAARYYEGVLLFGHSAYNEAQEHAREEHGRVYVSNNCRREFRIAIRYLNLADQWVTDYWWNFEPGETAYLAGVSTNNSIIYYYAELPDNSYRWSGGDRTYEVGSRRLGFRRYEFTGNRQEVSLACANL